jgi:predicted RNase H-like HicB family nuclease
MVKSTKIAMKKKKQREFYVVIEQDEDGYYVADVPELPGCHTQAKSIDELRERIQEAIELYLEVIEGKSPEDGSEFNC